MITSLSQLTMRRYINMVCGDLSVLRGKGEVVPQVRLQAVRNRLMYEFASLSNTSATRAYLSSHSKLVRYKAELLLFQVCNNLFAIYAFDDVRKILTEYGVNTQALDDSQLFDEIERQVTRCKRELKRMAKSAKHEVKEEPTPDEIRKMFDRETASLMTYFKFQIDLNKIPASQYACMMDQANREIKAKMNALSKK